MAKNQQAIDTTKKNSGRKVLVIISIICLILLAILILIYEEVEVERKSADLSKPTRLRKISKDENEDPAAKDTDPIDEKEVEVVSIVTKKKEDPEEEPTDEVKTEETEKDTPEKKVMAKPEVTVVVAAKSKANQEPEEKAEEKLESGYYLQVGAFADKENYEALGKELKKLGYSVFKKTYKRKISVYLVTLGRVSSKDAADKASQDIAKLKYKPRVKRISGNDYSVSVEPVLYEKKANAINDELKKAGLDSKVRKIREMRDIHGLLVGPYKSERDTIRPKKELAKKGHKTYMVKEE